VSDRAARFSGLDWAWQAKGAAITIKCMGAEGWYRDPFGVHDDRWVSGGEPTRLVRDRGVESHDEPPPGRPPGPLVPAGTAPPSDGPVRFPAPDWPFWTIIPPCLLAVLGAALGIVLALAGAALSSLASEGVSGYVPPNGGLIAAGIVGGFTAMVATFFLAMSGWPRRVAVLTAWGIVLLQAGWIILAYRLAFHHSI
jgi:hypothetical protein